MRLRVHTSATREMFVAAALYDKQVPGRGDRFIDQVERAFRMVREHPLIGHAVGSERQLPIRKFPYKLIYRAGTDQIQVLAVAHNARREGFWRRRRFRL